MTKAEHNKILEELLAQAPLAKVREDVILMSQLLSKDHQLQIMQKLINIFPKKDQAYQRLKAQVGKALEDLQK